MRETRRSAAANRDGERGGSSRVDRARGNDYAAYVAAYLSIVRERRGAAQPQIEIVRGEIGTR